MIICDPMDYSMPGSPVIHYLPELAQIYAHWVSNVVWQSHSMPPPSPFAFSFSWHQGLLQWLGSLPQVAKILELQLQHQSFPWIVCWFPLRWAGLISLQSKGLPRVFSSITIWKHQFFVVQHSNSHIYIWLLERPKLWWYGPLLAKWCPAQFQSQVLVCSQVPMTSGLCSI